ncbi:MAG: holliday junction resolvase, archaea type [archaeon GW2011_AR3]|nr:MAG: holliday junction resolvase, archaea type [archaeon GW2011_AR3]MBS3109406.1 Holliday junction resolvase [Candidatus Woesearchaeota archaeon]
MSHKSKGTAGERELVKRFWDNGWAAIRSPGSGSSRLPSPDIIAGTRTRKIVIEAKMTKDDRKYFEDEEIAQIRKFGEVFGAEPWVAVKFKGEDWLFLTLEDLAKTEKGSAITKDIAKIKGLLLEEVIK